MGVGVGFILHGLHRHSTKRRTENINLCLSARVQHTYSEMEVQSHVCGVPQGDVTTEALMPACLVGDARKVLWACAAYEMAAPCVSSDGECESTLNCQSSVVLNTQPNHFLLRPASLLVCFPPSTSSQALALCPL